MQIELEDIGKKFGRGFVFRHLSKRVDAGSCLGVVGSNGSGKSTLLQIIAGLQLPSEGLVHRPGNDKDFYKDMSFCSPATGLYEDFTLREHIQFYSELKPMSFSLEECIDLMQLEKHRNKQIKFFSSGMKQRVKLGLAIYAQTSYLFLDEPCSHLDKKSEEWFEESLKQSIGSRTVIIASNERASELQLTTERWNFSSE
jgi:ABC-type multidrug transport system ATPase subunit